MSYIHRTLGSILEQRIFTGKALVLIGARQVGKSTLLRHLVESRPEKLLSINCDDPESRSLLSGANLSTLRLLVGGAKIVLIDEAQRVDNIGMTLKMIVDTMPDVQLLVSGSSSLDLRNKLNEPLTGRQFEYFLYPLSIKELYEAKGLIEVRGSLEQYLIFGTYPDVVTHPADAAEILTNLSDIYLYKDILSLESVRRPELLSKILTALALQLGSEVSYNELAKTVGSDAKTVERYIDLLEKCFVIFRLGAFSRNLRNEIKKGRKIYFYDLGIRNAILRNFAPLATRSDAGALWENFFIVERLKANEYSRRNALTYFWRTTSQQEVDYIEEANGMINAFELKWNPRKAMVAAPKLFTAAYPKADFHVVTPDNYLEYLL
ncbi:MAG: ATP-binding protein [Muribaculaceae bacterium]|nr:ATP-binding protein [Muribaculaceae bacterium]